jgi:hypothetical protein
MKKIILYLLLFVSVAVSAQVGTFKSIPISGAPYSKTFTVNELPTTIWLDHSTITTTGDINVSVSPTPPNGTRWCVLNPQGVTRGNPFYNFCFFGWCPSDETLAYASRTDFVVENGVILPITYAIDPQANGWLSGNGIAANSIAFNKLVSAVPRSAIDTTGRGRVWVGDGSNITSTLYAAGSGKVLLGDGSDLTSVAVTGDIGISSTGVTSIASGAIVNADVSASAAIARSKLAAGTASQVVVNDGAGVLTSEATLNPLRGGLGADVSSSTGFVTFSAGSSTVGAVLDSKTFTVSFETGEQCNNRFKMPFAGTVNGVYAVCTKAIAGTDAGTIVLKNAAGTTMTAGTVTFAASDPLETAYTVTPSANNSFSAGDILYAVTSKTTAGGKVLLTITYNRVN